MWNSVVCNANYEEFLRQKEAKRINKSLSKVKSVVDNKGPKKVPHLKRRSKKYMKQEERLEEIDHGNMILMDKIFNINSRIIPESLLKKRVSHKSLNKEARVKSNLKINKENLMILQRIQTAQPVLSANRWESEERYRTEIKNIIQKGGRKSFNDIASSANDFSVKSFRRLSSRPNTSGI